MGQLRTANKRHKRAIVRVQALKAAAAAAIVASKPAEGVR